MDTLKSRLDAAVTLREMLSGALALPHEEMTLEAYLALRRGYHQSHEGRSHHERQLPYTFPWTEKVAGYGLACIASWVRDIPPDRGCEIEGGQREMTHRLLTIGGVPLLLRPIPGKGYPSRFAVAEGPHEGVEVEYAI